MKTKRLTFIIIIASTLLSTAFSFLIFADQKPLKPIKHNPRSIIEDKIKPVRHVRIERVIKPQNQRTDHCEEGYVDDCSGDGDCCPESWIGDG